MNKNLPWIINILFMVFWIIYSLIEIIFLKKGDLWINMVFIFSIVFIPLGLWSLIYGSKMYKIDEDKKPSLINIIIGIIFVMLGLFSTLSIYVLIKALDAINLAS